MFLPKTILSICSVWLLCSYSPLDALIVPQELPTILSLIYSNIPVIKKGTDSRLGFGYRFGNHADFQVMVELGPQKETRPIGDTDGDSSLNKRYITKAEQNALIRQQIREQLKRQQEQHEQVSTSTERNAANWLENWSQDMSTYNKKVNKSKLKQQKQDIQKQKPEKPNLAPNFPVLPSQSLQQLQLLYKLATTTIAPTAEEASKVFTESATPLDLTALAERLKKKSQLTKELMNVRLDENE